MSSKGIRILDKKNGIVCVELLDILQEIEHGQMLNWSILDLYATGHLGEGESIPSFQKEIYNSEKGLFLTWKELNSLSQKLYDLMDITIIGCKNKNLMHRYEDNSEIYKTCDIVIEMIDSSYWEVFSKDEDLVKRLAKKFKDVELLTAD